MPGRSLSVVDYPTSHLDFASIFLPILGANNPLGDYATALNLFHPGPRLLTFSDWNRIGICDGGFKASFRLRTGKHLGSKITIADDKPVDDEDAVTRNQPAISSLRRPIGSVGKDGLPGAVLLWGVEFCGDEFAAFL